MFELKTLLILIPAMPLAAAVLTAMLGPRLLRRRSHLPTVIAVAASFLASLVLVFQVYDKARETTGQGSGVSQIGYREIVPLWTWADVQEAYQRTAPAVQESQDTDQQAQTDPALADSVDEPTSTSSFQIAITLRVDSLTAMMLATVTLISMLVAVYSIGYMQGDPGYWRFFTFISLFVFSMTMLVSASNFVLLYVFWEAVGFCSYILIGFWYQKSEAAAAGKKAFLVNRVGDFGFALGVFLIWTTYGTLDFHDTVVNGQLQTAGVLGETMLRNPQMYVGGGVATAICLLLMLGACGKSAQFPLHIWLPDAMEGPSPVSALIHAATMVTAGVYMVTRCMPLFLASPYALPVVAVIGGFTALLAALIAITQTDLKRILAYSTISQLGYMFLGLGTGTVLGMTAGMFHLFTHAFFKALLFLGAGSVMHAMGNIIDIRQFGGLRRRMPTTHWTFLFGCLALSGFPFFAGFFSKDQILAAAHGQAGSLYQALFWVGVFTAFLTAFYTFRAYVVTFWGKERIPAEAGDHAHESPRVMTVPLIVLAGGALLAGYFFGWIHDFLLYTPSVKYLSNVTAHAPHDESGSHKMVMIVSAAVALTGIVLAWLLYAGKRMAVEQLARAADILGLYRLSHGKFFFDEIYNLLIVRPLQAVAWLSYWFDRYVIDGLVNACGMVPVLVGAVLRPLQNGLVPFYALAMVLGLLILIGTLLT
jgi:NADH-quinone oxidoreductase subunit L